MSAAFPGNRGKRPRPSTSNSFVKSVTEKVSGLLPASISKWFSSPKSTNINGSTTAAEATDSSTDDEDVPITTQPPPAKRMRFNPLGQHSQFNPVDTNWVPNSLEIKEPSSVTHSSTQSPPIRSMFRHENFVTTPVRRVNEESFVENNEQDNKMFRTQHSVSSIGQSVAKKREQIFKIQSTRTDTKQKVSPTLSQTRDPKEPYFKPSLLGSPFYSGRTMYGGASSSNMNETNIKQKKVILVNESKANDTTTMSHSTRTIMDLLENYSSPLSEARRLPQYVKNPNSDKINTSMGSYSQGSKDAYKTRELYVPHIASIVQIKRRSRLMDTTSAARQLIASHSSTIGFNPYPKMIDKQNQDEQEVDTLNSLRQYRLKTKYTRKNRDVDKFNEEISPINLPKAILQINPNNLPNFTVTTVPTTSGAFATVSPSTAPMSVTTAALTTSSMGFLTSTPINLGESRTTNRTNNADNHSSNGIFKFSEPDPVVCDLSMTTTQPFSCKFGSPEREKDNIAPLLHSTGEQENVTGIPTVKKDFILANMLKEQKHTDCCVNNKLDTGKCLSFGTNKPADKVDKSIKCVLCNLADAQTGIDKCINCERNKTNKTDTTQLKPKATWKCNECWVNNEDTVNKCVCCGAAKPNNSIPVSNKTPLNTAEPNWKCANCSNWNKDSLEKCVTCGGAKITAKESSTLTDSDTNKNNLLSTVKQTDDVFKNITKSQKSDKWECPICLVNNEKDKFECICCGTERENKKAAHNKIQFNFNSNVNTKFKFGIFNIEPQETEMDNVMEEESLPEIPKSLPEIPKSLPEIPKSVESAVNNMLSEMPTITNNNFGDKIEFSKEIEEESSKVKFALPEPTSAPPLNTIQLPSQASNLNIDKEKPQELPKIDFGRTEQNKQNSFFEFYTSKSKDTDSSKPISFMGSSISSHDKKQSQDYPTLPVFPSPAITTEQKVLPTQNAFRFSTSKLNLSGNPFESSVSTSDATTIPSMPFVMPVSTTTAASTIADIPIFSKSETNIHNTVSLFSKKDDVAATAKPLFQKSESVLKTTQTAVTTTPIFNFGSNTQNNSSSTPTETPKFNFAFGRTTQTSTIFKPSTFGTMSDSNLGSNKLTLSSGNTMSAGTGLFQNSLSGNGLSGGTTLTAVKSPTTNSLGGNTDASANTISGGSGLQTNNPLSSVFGNTGQKENMWSPNNNISNNLFVANTTGSTLPKPAPFAFGTSTPFNTHSSSTPAFGSNTQTTQNMFGMPSQTTGTQPAMFSSPPQNQTTPSVFGNPTPASNPAPSMANMFGTQNVGATPAFGTPNPSVPSFEAPAVNPAPTPAFNFSAAQSTNIIGFRQQTPQTAGVFGFGGSPAGTPQVQFNMGAAPNPAPNPNLRRVRKAVRRNPQSMNYNKHVQ